MSRPACARIDLAALQHNCRLAREHAFGAQVMAVLKADAYGHGLLRSAKALEDVADGFALIELEGAVMLRQSGVRQPILMMEGFYETDELPIFAEHGLVPVIHAPWQLKAMLATHLPLALDIALKLDTGMNRLGLTDEEFGEALAALHQARWRGRITLMTHFADADGVHGIDSQMQRFDRACSGLSLSRSLANSAALLRFGAQTGGTGNWVRPGIMLYGASPFPLLRSAGELGLRPVMTLESRIIATRMLKAGDCVGYGGTFAATHPMRVGVVACGYADGYPRHAPTGTPVLVDGQRTPLLGRVSMDKLCVDLTDLPKVGVGGTAVMWGRDTASDAVLPADEIASAAGTIAYELFCALGGRVDIDYLT